MSQLTASPYDSRDFRYTAKATRLPNIVSLKQFSSIIEDQSTTGTCAAHAITSGMELLLKRSGLSLQLSRLWTYWHGRLDDQRRSDNGANLRNVLKAMCQVGVIEERFFPFNIELVNQRPPEYVSAMGKKTYINRYLSVGTNTDYDISQIKAALAGGFPIAIGMDLEPWGYPGYLHALCIVGYDAEGFILENSWGSGWGDGGYKLVRYEDFKKFCFEAWVIDGLKDVILEPLWKPNPMTTRVFLDSDETFILSGQDITVYGGPRGNSILLLPVCSNIIFDQLVHTIEMPWVELINMSFMQQGTILHIYNKAVRLAYGGITRSGLNIIIDNGKRPLKITWVGAQMYFQNIAISSDGPTRSWI